MTEVFSRYIPIKGGEGSDAKRSIVPWGNPTVGVDFQTAKQQYSSYAGVLREDIVCIDVDTQENDPSQGLQTYEIINKYITTHNIKCRIMKTTKGWHFYFKKPESENNIGRHCPAILCCGLKVDYIVSPSYCVVKLNNQSRQLLSNPEELDELPLVFRLAVGDGNSVAKYNFYGAGHDQRYKAISGFKLVLLKKGLNQEELNECIHIACSLFAEKYDESKIKAICKIQDKEVEKINLTQTSFDGSLDSLNEKTLKKLDKVSKLTDLEGTRLGFKLVEKYSIIAIDNDFKNLYYKKTPDDIYTPIILDESSKSRLEYLCRKETSKTITHSCYKTIRDEIKANMSEGSLEKFTHYICTSDNKIIDTNSLEVVDNKEAIVRIRLNCKYDKTAYSKTVDDAINRFCNYDKQLRLEFEEVIGQCILPTNEVKAFTIIQGEPNSGKTTIMNMIKNMIGEGNTSSLNLEDIIKEPFFAWKLDGKTANIGDETTGTDKLSIEKLKALTGDSVITVNKKNVNPFDMRNGATFVFLCNEFPTFKIIDYALQDRLHLMHIPNNNFPKNPKFLKEVSTEEAKSYLLNLAIKGIKRVRANNYEFTKSLNSIQTKNRYIGQSDILKRFLGNIYHDFQVDIFNNKEWNIENMYDQFCVYFEDTYGNKFEKWSRTRFTRNIKKELCCDAKRTRIGEKNDSCFVRLYNSRELKEFEKYCDENLDKNPEQLELENIKLNRTQSIEVFSRKYIQENPELNVPTINVYLQYEGVEKTDLDSFERDFSFYARCLVVSDFKNRYFVWKREDKPTEDTSDKTPAPTSTQISTDNVLNESSEKDLIFYDFEVFKYDWMVTCKIFKTKRSIETLTIINNKQELQDLWEDNKKAIWIGYNSNHYDLYIFKAILKNIDPFKVSQTIINDKEKVYKKFDFSGVLKGIRSYDCSVKNGGFTVGLKELEAYMGDDIQESSVDFNIDRKLTLEELEEVKGYNIHDVEETVKIFQNNLNTFEANLSIIDTFKLPSTDISKTQAQLAAKVLNCKRPFTDRTDETDIEILPAIKIEKNLDVVDWYLNGEWIKPKSQLNKIINGIPHTFGIGGLHGAVDHPIHKKGTILHLDVNSYYPSLAIQNSLLTRNSQTPDVYKQIYEKRLQLKKEGKKAEQAPYKIILNATYGITKDKFSDAYDPRQGNMICINGQLALLDLIEKLEGKCDLLQSNTDGLIVKCTNEDDVEEIKNICHKWEQRFNIGLGFDYIEEIWQKDANNYMIRYTDGKIECKGIDLAENTPNKNNCGIVGRAVREYLLNGTPLIDTISNPDNDLIEYQIVAKAGGTYDGGLYYGSTKLTNKYNRVFASKNESAPTVYKLKLSKQKKQEAKAVFEDIQTQANEPPLGSERVPNLSEHVFIENGNINDKKLDDRIDLDFYVKQAETILKRFVK